MIDKTLSAERVGEELLWQIYVEPEEMTAEQLNGEGEQPDYYALYLTEAAHGHFNMQVVLARVLPGEPDLGDIYVYDHEVYSTFVYIAPGRRADAEELLCDMIRMLSAGNVINPIELTHAFGGMVRGRPVQMGTMHPTH
ncbi:protein kinase [Burkholderia phage BcepSauron]|uniref:Protein kinase n=1 Tax=Burkholderia phage BcepSauron TaxID=2530033 RepID=A0A482MM59_9CAUD|nr:protein kinase [Burkholderia phage BcepSauron]QBQ74606.1 protein kinase [Burkholderia phage BcepSauron]